MAGKQMDVSPETQRIYAEKLKRKLELRNEFLKLKTDPFRHAINEGGAVVSYTCILGSIYEDCFLVVFNCQHIIE